MIALFAALVLDGFPHFGRRIAADRARAALIRQAEATAASAAVGSATQTTANEFVAFMGTSPYPMSVTSICGNRITARLIHPVDSIDWTWVADGAAWWHAQAGGSTVLDLRDPDGSSACVIGGEKL